MIAQLEDKGEDLSEPPREVRRLEGRGWIEFEGSVRASVKSFYPK